MTTEKKLAVEQAQEAPVKSAAVTQAVTQMEEILDKTVFDTLVRTTPDQLQNANPEGEVIKGTARGSQAWRHAPAQFEFLAVAEQRLNKVAAQAGLNVQKVEKVYASLVKGTKLLIIRAAPPNDLSAYPVNRFGRSGAWINLIDLLGEVKFTTEPGWKERFQVAYIPKGSPVWPGLVIDLSNPKERRSEGKKKDDE